MNESGSADARDGGTGGPGETPVRPGDGPGKDRAIVAPWEQEAAARGRQLASILRGLAEAKGRIASLRQLLRSNDERSTKLTRQVEEREVSIGALSEALRRSNERLSSYARELAEKNGRIAQLEKALQGKETLLQQVGIEAVQLHHRLVRIRDSLDWKLSLPLRILRRVWWRLRREVPLDVVAFHQLRGQGADWVATGDDPQFLLFAEPGWQALAGWHWLEMRVACPQPLAAHLYFDFGAGFDEGCAIGICLSGDGMQRIPLYVPRSCRAIRFDPCDAPGRFRLARPRLKRLSEPPSLPPGFAEQAQSYATLRRKGEEVAALEPVNDARPETGSGYTWRSEGTDPWFTVRHAAQTLQPGWHEVEVRVCAELGEGRAKLYFDFGEGYSEANCVELPFVNGETVSRLFCLRDRPRQVRLDPVDQAGRFSVEHLRFSPVTPLSARNRMVRRVCERHPDHRGERAGRVWLDLQRLADAHRVPALELLVRRYGETFPAHGPHDTVSYAEWIAKVEAPELSDPDAIARAQQGFAIRPVVSVVMPVYNTAESFLRRAIESVLCQSYPHWELCIADDASTEPQVRAVIEEYARRDSRIRCVFREENGHICAASNSALALATGDYVALLDHDDELAPHALHFVAEAIERNPSAQILYSDEDKIDEAGKRSDPHFKSDWNPDLFFSQNYVSHLGVYRADLLRRIGGFRPGVEGSQDQDLLLRCLPHVKPAEIVHIPRVLYHWRVLPGSTALGAGEKSYTTAAGIRALEDYFRSQGHEDVKVEPGLVPNTYRVRYPVPQPQPLVSLLIPTRDKLQFLEPCIRSILERTTYGNYEILILDNESSELATLEYFARIQAADSRVRVLSYPHPFNFSAINNYGVRHARGEIIGLVNNDVEVIGPDWLTEMVSHAVRPEIGCVGAKLYYDDGSIQHAGVILGIGGVAGHSHKYFPRASDGYFSRLKIVQNVSAVTAACLVVRKSVYEEVGGLDEDNLGVAFNDVDFCLKVREAGYRNLWTPYAELYHHESKSRGGEDTPEKAQRFRKEIEFMQAKWGEALRSDPYYSRNLTRTAEDFSFSRVRLP